MGTPFYISPEQIRGSKNIDARSDQHSRGVILDLCTELPAPAAVDTSAVVQSADAGSPGEATALDVGAPTEAPPGQPSDPTDSPSGAQHPATRGAHAANGGTSPSRTARPSTGTTILRLPGTLFRSIVGTDRRPAARPAHRDTR